VRARQLRGERDEKTQISDEIHAEEEDVVER